MEGDEIGNVDVGENVAMNHQKRIFPNAILGQFERASRVALGPLTKVVDGSAETLAMPDEPRTSPRPLRWIRCGALELDAQTVGDTIHKGEIGRNRADIVNAAVVEAKVAQPIYVASRDRVG